MLKKTLRVIGWSLGGLCGLVVALYLVVLAINGRDQEPSATAIHFANLYRDRPIVADKDNAYVYLMGFDVPPGNDPIEMGIKRVAWMTQGHQAGHFDAKGDPQTEHYDISAVRSPLHQQISDSCRTADTKCSDVFRDERVLEAWLSSEDWLLRRYQSLTNLTGWRETVPLDLATPFPNYRFALDGQRLLFAKLTLLANNKNYADVKMLMAGDIRFWRQALESADNLISKMIATAALRQHFELGNLILRIVPSSSVASVIPAEWQVGMRDSERSMLRCYVGEWMFGSNVIRQTARNPRDALAPEYDGESSVGQKIFWTLATPMFQVQDSINKNAEFLAELSAKSNVPYDEYEKAMKLTNELVTDSSQEAMSIRAIYNPLGRWLLALGAGSYESYGYRVADLEGMRRAALATIALRESKVLPGVVSDALAQSTMRNPYNQEPFTWDAEKAAVLFTGIESGERRKHFFLY